MYYFVGKQEFTIEELLKYVKSHRVNPEQLEHAARLPIAEVRAAVAANPSTQARALNFLAKDPSEAVRLAAAKHQNISPDALWVLAHDASRSVLLGVANNPRANQKTLDFLSRKSDWEIRLAVVNNSQTSPVLLRRLCSDGYLLVRMAANKRCRHEVLRMRHSVMAVEETV